VIVSTQLADSGEVRCSGCAIPASGIVRNEVVDSRGWSRSDSFPKPFGGSGLGLPLTKGAVRGHNRRTFHLKRNGPPERWWQILFSIEPGWLGEPVITVLLAFAAEKIMNPGRRRSVEAEKIVDRNNRFRAILLMGQRIRALVDRLILAMCSMPRSATPSRVARGGSGTEKTIEGL